MEGSKTGKKADRQTTSKEKEKKKQEDNNSFNLCRNTTYLFIPDYCITALWSERKYDDWRFLFDPGMNKPVLRQFHAVCSRA